VSDFRLMGGPGHERAKAAVRQMGTNAIPKLIEMLRAEDPTWKLKVRDWTESWPIKYRFHPASIKHWRAITALEALGPAAVPMLLDLQHYTLPRNALQEQDAISARNALIQIGENAVSPLVSTLTNSNPEVRMRAVVALGWLGSDAVAAVPALLKALDDPVNHGNGVREAVMQALKEIEPEPDVKEDAK